MYEHAGGNLTDFGLIGGIGRDVAEEWRCGERERCLEQVLARNRVALTGSFGPWLRRFWAGTLRSALRSPHMQRRHMTRPFEGEIE
jgi:hypothetical protein